MLVVVTIRSEGSKYAEGHIAEIDSDRVFCGIAIPSPVMECGLRDPKNPYVGKAKATCQSCVSEWKNGRTTGYRERGNGQAQG